MTLVTEDRVDEPNVAPTSRPNLSSPGRRIGLSSRLTIVAAVLFLEKFALNFFVDFDSVNTARGFGALVRAVQHFGFRFVVTLAISTALFTYARNPGQLGKDDSAARATPLSTKWLLAHIAFFPPLALATFLLYGEHGIDVPFPWRVGVWLLLALAAVWTLLEGMGMPELWRGGVGKIRVTSIYALVTAAVSASAMQWGQSLWTGMAQVTFAAVHSVLVPIIPQLHADASTRVIDTGRFAIEIVAGCSGLEGMGLMLAFCIAWLALFRHEYIFPRALLLIPAGLVLSFALNVFRIAALLLIGHGGLPAMAVEGFHSQAGWIAFNCAAGLIAFVSLKSPWLNRPTSATAAVATENPTAAYLLPFLAILAAGMVARVLSTGFEILYFLRPLAAALLLYRYWPRLAQLRWSISWRGPVAGLTAFLIWAITAHALTQQEPMPAALANSEPLARDLWIAIRVVGSVIAVPLAEELAYRGFLLRRMVAADFETVRFKAVGVWSLLASSIIFGISHGSMWIAGIAAGLVYGWVLIRTESMGEAVAGHATTNALVAVAVLSGNQWQLWL